MLWNGGGLGTDKSNIPVVPLDPLKHRSLSVTNVNLTAFKGNPLNHANLLGQLDIVSRLDQVWPKCCVGLENGAYTLIILFVSYHVEQPAPFPQYLSLTTIKLGTREWGGEILRKASYEKKIKLFTAETRFQNH